MTKQHTPEWVGRFEKLWLHLNDWTSSGFRYGDPRLTNMGIKKMKPEFQKLLRSELKSLLDQIEKEVIGEDQSEKWGEVFNPEIHINGFRNELRQEQRARLEALRSRYE